MEKGLVSILIVSYNCEKYIRQAILSCLNQTYGKTEILLLDNASKDRTLEKVRELNENGRIKIFENRENVGPYKGLNFLMGKASGEFIAIQDHDDIWFPEKIEKQANFLEHNQKTTACGAQTFYFYEGRGKLILDARKGFVNLVDHTSLFFRNEGFRYDTAFMLSDEHFEKKIIGEKGLIFCLDNPLNIHRIRSDRRNYSLWRFHFTARNIKDFFEINGFGIKPIFYLAGIFVAKYFPEKLLWLIIRAVKWKSLKMSVSDFNKKYPAVNL